MNLIQELEQQKLITPPYWLPTNICLLARTGSFSYGCSIDNSDQDIYGVVCPTREILFPHEKGYILGFGTPPQKFEQYVDHNIIDGDKEYDITVYNIVKFFELCRGGNPNLIDALFTPSDCILYITKSGNLIRENRKLFLSKALWPKFKGFIFNHYRNLQKPKTVGKRAGLVEAHGYDIKDFAHCARTLLNLKEILINGDFDPRKYKDMILEIRRGEWPYEKAMEWIPAQESELEILKEKSSLPEVADEDALKQLLLECLEIHYGKLHNVIFDATKPQKICREILNLLQQNLGTF